MASELLTTKSGNTKQPTIMDQPWAIYQKPEANAASEPNLDTIMKSAKRQRGDDSFPEVIILDAESNGDQTVQEAKRRKYDKQTGKDTGEDGDGEQSISNKRQGLPPKKPSSNTRATRSSRTPGLETPGDPDYPNSFIDAESNEKKVAAYLGFDTVADLRILAVSWPVLRAVSRYKLIPRSLSKSLAYKIISGSNGPLIDSGSLFLWLKDLDCNEYYFRIITARHLAIILLDMEKDIQAMSSNSEQTNEDAQFLHLERARQVFKDRGNNIATIEFSSAQPAVKLPMLGPYEIEDRLEPINRCLNLLDYVLDSFLSNAWLSRFSKKGLMQKGKVGRTFIPPWMRDIDKTPGISDAVAETSAEASATATPAETLARGAETLAAATAATEAYGAAVETYTTTVATANSAATKYAAATEIHAAATEEHAAALAALNTATTDLATATAEVRAALQTSATAAADVDAADASAGAAAWAAASATPDF